MVSVCLPSVVLSQHLLSYLGFSYLGREVSLHGCFSKVQPLLLTLDDGYVLTASMVRSYPRPRSGAEAGRAPCPRGSGREELPHVRGQGWQPKGVIPCPRSGVAAQRSYPASTVRGCGRECQAVTAQEQLRGATPAQGQGLWLGGAAPGGATLRP